MRHQGRVETMKGAAGEGVAHRLESLAGWFLAVIIPGTSRL